MATTGTKVKDLIEALLQVDQEAIVYAYDKYSEEWCGAFKVQSETDFPYVKGDPPENLENFILLYGKQY